MKRLNVLSRKIIAMIVLSDTVMFISDVAMARRNDVYEVDANEHLIECTVLSIVKFAAPIWSMNWYENDESTGINKTHDMHNVLEIKDHVFNSPQAAAGGNKTQSSNTITSTSFPLEFWSNKIIDVDIILFITLTVS